MTFNEVQIGQKILVDGKPFEVVAQLSKRLFDLKSLNGGKAMEYGLKDGSSWDHRVRLEMVSHPVQNGRCRISYKPVKNLELL